MARRARGGSGSRSWVGLALVVAFACGRTQRDDAADGSGGTAGGDPYTGGTTGTGATMGSGGTTVADAQVGGSSSVDASADAAVDSTTTETGSDAMPGAPPVGLAFDVPLGIGPYGKPWCMGPCEPAVLFVEKATASGLDVVWGAPGHAARTTLVPSGSGWALTAPLRLATGEAGYNLCPPSTDLTQALFEFADHDNDSVIDLLITGHQKSDYCSEDTFEPSESDVTLVGQLDAKPPKALWTDDHSTFWGVSAAFDEPLEQSATALLAFAGSSQTIAMTMGTESQYVVSFGTDRVLPLAASYTVTFGGKDLASLGSPGSVKGSTLPDFGVLVQDGFESGSTTGIHSAAAIDLVSAYFGVNTIAGTRMLHASWVPVLLRLQRVASETTLRMKVIGISECTPGKFTIDVGIVGSSKRTGMVLPMSPTKPGPKLGSHVGPLQDLTIFLPDSGKDVLVMLDGETNQGFSCVDAQALVDDVWLE